ncbi:MAG: AmmeMemoRadiSam system radical SAM enzyme [Patescibacteria group bacterium]
MRQKEVYLYKKLKNGKAQCQNCAHYCVILPRGRGICGMRENTGGKLFALNYGKIIALSIDPIEKKPLFHFLPGSQTLSIAAVGCNLKCANCQNWDISQGYKKAKIMPGQDLSPHAIVKIAKEKKLPSISYTYTEPTIFSEFALDTMKIAKSKGLKNVFVSNGFMSKESAKMLIPYLDANSIDIKSFSNEFYRKNCGGRLQPVLETAKLMKKSGIWLEITTLAIPGLSDSKENFSAIAKFIYDKLGSKTPWHISAFSGQISWKLKHIADTPLETLGMAYKIGKEAGLKYVYTGNAPSMPSEDTFCPNCGELCIDRAGYNISRHDKSGKCPKCLTKLDITD